jgi:hypothetical protein
MVENAFINYLVSYKVGTGSGKKVRIRSAGSPTDRPRPPPPIGAYFIEQFFFQKTETWVPILVLDTTKSFESEY